MNGKITKYDPFNKRGKISGDDGEHQFDASSELAGDLSNTIIPPDAPVAVTYDVAGTGEAINVVLAQSITLAASAEPMAVKSFAAKQAGKKPAPKKKAVKAPAKTAKKKSASKKVAAKKSRKQPRKSAPKRRRP
jgi:ABC-type phosphate transport system substrate-binding protein